MEVNREIHHQVIDAGDVAVVDDAALAGEIAEGHDEEDRQQRAGNGEGHRKYLSRNMLRQLS